MSLSFAPLSSVQLHFAQFSHRTIKGRRFLGDLVLIHGLAANMAFWHPRLIQALRRLVNVTAYDLRGHGRSTITPTGYCVDSMAEDLKGLLDYLEISQANLLAHSFGGTVALWFALKYPQRVKSLIIADTRLSLIQPKQYLKDFEAWPIWQESFRELGFSLNENDPEGGYQLLDMMARLHLLGKIPGHIILPHLFVTRSSPSGSRGAQHWLKLNKITNIREEVTVLPPFSVIALNRLTIPLLALYGERSQSIPTAQALIEYCPSIRLEMIASVGHFFPLQKPKWLAARALRFLRRLNR